MCAIVPANEKKKINFICIQQERYSANNEVKKSCFHMIYCSTIVVICFEITKLLSL